MNSLLAVFQSAAHGLEAASDSRNCQTLRVPQQSWGFTHLNQWSGCSRAISIAITNTEYEHRARTPSYEHEADPIGYRGSCSWLVSEEDSKRSRGGGGVEERVSCGGNGLRLCSDRTERE